MLAVLSQFIPFCLFSVHLLLPPPLPAVQSDLRQNKIPFLWLHCIPQIFFFFCYELDHSFLFTAK